MLTVSSSSFLVEIKWDEVDGVAWGVIIEKVDEFDIFIVFVLVLIILLRV